MEMEHLQLPTRHRCVLTLVWLLATYSSTHLCRSRLQHTHTHTRCTVRAAAANMHFIKARLNVIYRYMHVVALVANKPTVGDKGRAASSPSWPYYGANYSNAPQIIMHQMRLCTYWWDSRTLLGPWPRLHQCTYLYLLCAAIDSIQWSVEGVLPALDCLFCNKLDVLSFHHSASTHVWLQYSR